MTSALLQDFATKMDAALDHIVKEFAGINTGKATPSMVETIRFAAESYGGTTMAIKDAAAVSTPDARTIVIQPWDKGLLKDIEKGITNANLGFNPRADADKIMISIPDLTKERRAELVKVASKMAEEGKVVLRNIRHDGLDLIRKQQKAAAITEDDLKRLEKQLQDITDLHAKKIDEVFAKKEKDLTTV